MLADPAPVARRLAELRRLRGPVAGERCSAVRELVVVCSSSRGGSSLFGELLRASPELLHFSAEINPHFVIPTLGRGGCDLIADPTQVCARDPGRTELRTELGLDIGRPAIGLPDADVDDFALSVAWRLTMQWPAEDVDPEAVRGWVRDTLTELRARDGWAPRAFPDRAAFLCRLLPRVRSAHPSVDPYRYDLQPRRVAAGFPGLVPPSGPPHPVVVEMAPFVLPRPWRRATDDEAGAAPLVANTPRNAFRLPLLQLAFPNARLRVLHLVRNPAAAINGLVDGWRHRGFFSCRTDAPLSIDGYPDGSWWNYDLPPGWRDWTSAPLVQVCGFQWRAAHEATLAAIERCGYDHHRLRFEDLTGPVQRRRAVLRELAGWLGIDPAAGARLGDGTLPVVMPTAPPRPGRWRDRADELAPVLADPAIRAMAERLGYPRDPAAWT